MGGGGQVRCERRSEVFVKIKEFFFLGGGVGGGGEGLGVGLGGQGGCKRRIEVFVKIKKNQGGEGLVLVGSGRGGGGRPGWWGVRVDVNAILEVRGDVGYGDMNQE